MEIFKPNHQDQSKDDNKRVTEDNESNETRDEDPDQGEESKERVEDESETNRANDTNNKGSKGDSKTTTEDKQEQTDRGRKNTQTEKHESREQTEHRQDEPSDEHQTSGKRKEGAQTRPGESGRNVKRKPRKKMIQNTFLTQYMNMNGGGKRKRNQTAHGDTNGNDKSYSEDGQGTKKPKRTLPRQTETIKRKGIG